MRELSKAGSTDKCDVLITLYENEDGIEIQLNSPSAFQFGRSIKDEIIATLNNLGVENMKVKVEDNGALDFTIKSRVETAYFRYTQENIDWRKL
ncbi:MAG: citrate lyase acyl carrier protein [Peptoniphilus sp.]|nr:citrate lyase acyl carrier protein [Peptoniphilus sp.]